MFEPTFHNLVTLPGATPELTVVKAAAPAPEGYTLYPFGTGLGWRLTYTGVDYSSITIRICGLPSGLSESELDSFKIRQYKVDGTVNNLSTTRVEGCVTANTQSNSIFAVVAPISIYDQSGPEVYFTASRVFVQGETVYVSSAAQLSLNSVDFSSNTDVLAGVASTYYLLDAEPTQECLSTTYNPGATPGTCENPLYGGAFSAREGVRSLYRWAVDKIGNVGPGVGMTLLSDGTAPAGTLAINGAPIAAGATVYASSTDTITLAAEDILSNGLASGWATTYFMVDVSTDNCGFMDWFGGVDGMGTCENPYYAHPFNLPAGEHIIHFYGEDKVGNLEPVRSVYFVVSAPNPSQDIIPPVVKAWVKGQELADGATVYMSAADGISITATDESGETSVYYSLDTVFSTATAIAYSGPFMLSVDTYVLRYSAMDGTGNLAAPRTAYVNVWNSTVACGGTITQNTILVEDLDCSGVTDTAVIIGVNDITFDGGGHKIIAPGAANAVSLGARNRVIIKNLDVSGSGTGSGIFSAYNNDGIYEGIKAHGRDIAINLAYGNNNTIVRNNDLSGNRVALKVSGSSNTVTGNKLTDSVIAMDAGGAWLTLAPDNDFSGSTTAISLIYATDMVIENLTLNNLYPIYIGEGKRLTLRNLDLSGNGEGKGIVSGYGENNVFENITVHERDTGIALDFGNKNCVVRNNDLSGNRVALKIAGSSNTVTGNKLTNSLFGLAAEGIGLVLLPDNDYSGSTTAVALGGLSDSVIEGLVLSNPKGIAGGSSKRLVFRNLDLSGTGGMGMEFNSTEDSVYENITVHGRDVGLRISDNNKNSVIRNNDLSGNNNGLYVSGSTMTVTGNNLSNNVTGLVAVGSNLILKPDNDFSGSATAVGLGGLSDSVIEGLVLSNPKGIAGGSSKRLVFRNLDLSGTGGMGMEFNNTEDSVYENITAHGREVGLRISDNNRNSMIRNNDLSGNQNGLYVNGSTMTVTGNNLSNNVTGLFAVGMNLILKPDNGFANSTAAVVLGGLSDSVIEGLNLDNAVGITVYASNNITVRNAKLSGAIGKRDAIGLNLTNSSRVRIENVLVSNRDYGFKLDGPCLENLLLNDTVVNSNSGVVISPTCSGVSIVNSLLWWNDDDLRDQSGTASVSYSNIQEALFPGVGNMNEDPVFMNPANGDYRLGPWSSCVDAGSNNLVDFSKKDLLGNPRVFDGNNDGTAVVDMGVYESQVAVSTPTISDIAPSSGTAGQIFAVVGSNFGIYSAASSQVYVGTYTTTLTAWSDTRIEAEVPSMLVPGIYPVTVETGVGGVATRAGSDGFTVLPLVNSSADGMAVIITPGVDISVTAISTATLTSTMTVYGSMVNAGLEPVTDAFFEFDPSGVQFAAPATLRFAFDPVGVDTATLAIYYFDGVNWSSSSVLNQRVVFDSANLAYLEGEIMHTSMYALLKKSSAVPVALDIDPDTLNLKSKGETITAHLSLPGACFDHEDITISAVNGQKLGAPVLAQPRGSGFSVECGTASVKFSRDAVAAVVPVNAQVKLTVSGALVDGRAFSADDTIRTIKPTRVSAEDAASPSVFGAEFKLGEVYVYPNPAKGGKIPTFHIEVGVADSVKVRVYTVAGILAHEHTLSGVPQVIGGVYAYEYAWQGHIASGVYYYTVEAERAGKKIKTRGRFAVVR
ncbi:MAG: right-handed parallel beta-helix repeat-containing protein [Elusimicrobiales bacterium]